MFMPEDIKKILNNNQVIVFSISHSQYSEKIEKLCREICKLDCNVLYVTLNKPTTVIESFLKNAKADLNKFYFVDCVSKLLGAKKQVSVVSSPQALTELNITINKTLKKEKVDIIIFDSLSTLIAYNDSFMVVKFIHSFISNIRQLPTKILFTLLKEDEGNPAIKDVSMFVDKVTEL